MILFDLSSVIEHECLYKFAGICFEIRSAKGGLEILGLIVEFLEC